MELEIIVIVQAILETFPEAANQSHSHWYTESVCDICNFRISWGLLIIKKPSWHKIITKIVWIVYIRYEPVEFVYVYACEWEREDNSTECNVDPFGDKTIIT